MYKNHYGTEIEFEFPDFIKPPVSLGSVLSVGMKKRKSLLSFESWEKLSYTKRYYLFILIGIFIGILYKRIQPEEIAIFISLALVVSLIMFLLFFFRENLFTKQLEYSFVCEEGLAVFYIDDKKGKIVDEKVLEFDAAKECYSGRTERNLNAVYQKTHFSYYWVNKYHELIFEIEGFFYENNGIEKDENSSLYFGISGEKVWSNFLLKNIFNNDDKNNYFQIDLPNNHLIRLFVDQIEVYDTSNDIVFNMNDIKNISVSKGVIKFEFYKKNSENDNIKKGHGFSTGDLVLKEEFENDALKIASQDFSIEYSKFPNAMVFFSLWEVIKLFK
jgi:hypothetical protein